MNKFKVGDKVRRLPEYRDCGGWARGGSVMVVEVVAQDGWLGLAGYKNDWGSTVHAFVSPVHFELAQPLARDELYIRLRNEAGLSHQHATAFIKECPPHADIRRALDDGYPTGRIMARLVVWEDTPQGHAFWSAHAKACPGGWV